MKGILMLIAERGILSEKERETACSAFLVTKPNGRDNRFEVDLK